MGAMPWHFGIALASLVVLAAQARAEEAAWGLAPMRWRGLIATDVRQFSADGQPRRLHRVDSGQVQVSSYVWQPWFAQVQGGLGAVSSSERGENDSRSASLTGNGMLNLFPASRFPFHASFDVSDSRSADRFTGQTYQSKRYGLRQSHRSVSGAETSTASYTRSTLESSSFGRDTVDVLNGSHSRRLGSHTLDGNTDFTRNRRHGSDEHAQFTRLFGRHAWSSGALASLDSSASYGESDLQLGAGGPAGATRTEFLQLNNFFSWRRDEDDPLTVTGGARFFRHLTEGPAASTEARSLMGHGNGVYRYSRNLLLNAGASAAETRSAGKSDLLATQSAGASYNADPRRLGAYLYNVNVGASLHNQAGGEGSRRLASGQVGHNLMRSFEPAEAQSITATLAQTFGEARDSTSGALHSLSHSASVMWRALRGSALGGLAGVSAADSRTRGHSSSTFQLVNAQASGQAQFDRHSTLLGNLTVQRTRQASGAAPLGAFDTNINGGITYQHQRAFGVPRLRYLAVYERNDYRLNTRLEGDADATREHVAASFEQRLEYRIGKLELRASLRLAEVDGKESALLFLRIARELGDW